MARSTAAGWTVTHAAAESWRRCRDGHRSLPRAAWRRFGAALAVGFAATAGVTWGLTWLGEWLAPRGLQAWAEAALRTVVEYGPMSFVDATVFESPGNLAYLVPLTAVAAVIAARAGRPVVAASIAGGYVVQRAFVFLGWWLWDRPRPDWVAEGIAAPALHSYPSGHAALACFVYGYLTWLWMRVSRSPGERVAAAAALIVWLTPIAWARLRMGTHWPSDVVAGLLIGLCWTIAVAWATVWAESPRVGARS